MLIFPLNNLLVLGREAGNDPEPSLDSLLSTSKENRLLAQTEGLRSLRTLEKPRKLWLPSCQEFYL